MATKASQAVTYPALLVAHLVKESAKVGIDIVLEDVEFLDPSSKASVTLSDQSGEPIVETGPNSTNACFHARAVKATRQCTYRD